MRGVNRNPAGVRVWAAVGSWFVVGVLRCPSIIKDAFGREAESRRNTHKFSGDVGEAQGALIIGGHFRRDEG